jgi:hypothetical protein
VVWELCREDEKSLDRYEGVEFRTYAKEEVEVLMGPGGRERAFAYVAGNKEEGFPIEGYLERIVLAARLHGFPPAYVDELSSWSRERRLRPILVIQRV